MMNKIKLDCGCEFETNKDGIPIVDYNFNKLNLECKETWDLIGRGDVTGVFQLESGLGHSLSKKLKPDNLEQLAALISIMRPSCLNGYLADGKSITNHYIDRKHNREPATAEYPVLSNILKNTFQLSLYQEDVLNIAKEIAGFDLQKSDDLRRAMGKKKSDLMSKLEAEFIEGCEKVGKVSKDEAEAIFAWCKASQRYSFNRSHALEYATTTYATALVKTHFPLRFFKSWLNASNNKQNPLEEIKSLALDARQMSVDIVTPDLRLKNPKFIIKDGRIYFGLQYIKGCGEAAIKALLSVVDSIQLDKCTWISLLFTALIRVNKTLIKHMIAAGGLDWLKIPREQLLFEHEIAMKLSDREVKWICENMDLNEYKSIKPILSHILSLPSGKNRPISNKTRKNIINSLSFSVINPPFALIDNIERLALLEESFLGVALSCSKIDAIEKNDADTFCVDFLAGKDRGAMRFIVEIVKAKVIRTKTKGEEMAFISILDNSGMVSEVVCFPKQYKKYGPLLTNGNTIVLTAKRGKQDSLILEECIGI